MGPVKCSWTSGASPSPVTTKPCHSPAEHNESDITVAQSGCALPLPDVCGRPGDKQRVPDPLCVYQACCPAAWTGRVGPHICVHIRIFKIGQNALWHLSQHLGLPSFCLVHFMEKSSYLLPFEPLCLRSLIISRKKDLCVLIHLMVSLRVCLPSDAYVPECQTCISLGRKNNEKVGKSSYVAMLIN